MSQKSQAMQQRNQNDAIRKQLANKLELFTAALPQGMTFEKFQAVILLACTKKPDLVQADRASLITSCLEAAKDGLMPDGKEGALVVYNTNIAPRGQKEDWVQLVQWMPMISGIYKKLYNSGKVDWIGSNVVHENDSYRLFTNADGENVHYERARLGSDRGKIIGAYAAVKLTGGQMFAEEMDQTQLDQIKGKSKTAKKGPWADPAFVEEMMRKTVFRRLSKRLPLSAEDRGVIERDDAFYDIDHDPREPVPRKLGTRMQALADVNSNQQQIGAASGLSPAPNYAVDKPSESPPHSNSDDADGSAAKKQADPPAQHTEVQEITPAQAFDAGCDAAARGMIRSAVPKQYDTPTLRPEFERGHDSHASK